MQTRHFWPRPDEVGLNHLCRNLFGRSKPSGTSFCRKTELIELHHHRLHCINTIDTAKYRPKYRHSVEQTQETCLNHLEYPSPLMLRYLNDDAQNATLKKATL